MHSGLVLETREEGGDCNGVFLMVAGLVGTRIVGCSVGWVFSGGEWWGSSVPLVPSMGRKDYRAISNTLCQSPARISIANGHHRQMPKPASIHDALQQVHQLTSLAATIFQASFPAPPENSAEQSRSKFSWEQLIIFVPFPEWPPC